MSKTFHGAAGSYRAAMRKDIGWTVMRVTEEDGRKIIACKVANREEACILAEAMADEGKFFDTDHRGYITDAAGMARARAALDQDEASRKDHINQMALRGTERFRRLTEQEEAQKRENTKETGMADEATETDTTEETKKMPETKTRRSRSASTKGKASSKTKTKKATVKKATTRSRASAEEHGEQVVAMRAEGESWAKIADELDLGTPGVARRIWSQQTGQHHSLSRVGKGGRLPKDPEVLEQMREAGLLTGTVHEALEPLVGVAFKDLAVNDVKAAVKETGVEPDGRKKSDLVRALVEQAGLPEPDGLPEA